MHDLVVSGEQTTAILNAAWRPNGRLASKQASYTKLTSGKYYIQRQTAEKADKHTKGGVQCKSHQEWWNERQNEVALAEIKVDLLQREKRTELSSQI